MNNIFFSADLHLSHFNIIRHCNRPYTPEEHDQAIIDNWNSVVSRRDTVYLLGDFAMVPKQKDGTDRMKVYRKLRMAMNGKVHLVVGNHDTMSQDAYSCFTEVYDFGKEIKIDGTKITICHYPLLSWNRSFHNQKQNNVKYCSLMFHGHCHNRLVRDNPFRVDVGVDGWNYKPVHFDDLIKDIENYRNLLWSNNSTTFTAISNQ